MFKLNQTLSEVLVASFILFCGFWIINQWTVNFRQRRRRVYELVNCLPGPQSYPFIGNALKFACKTDNLLNQMIDIVKPYINSTPMKLWIGPILYIVVTTPEDIEVILNSQEAANKGSSYRFLLPYIGDGLITGSGKTWRTHRKLVTRTMNTKSIRYYVNIFDKRCQRMVEKLRNFADGKQFDIMRVIEGCTVDIVCETIMGCSDINAQDNLNQDFIQSSETMYELAYDRMAKVWLHPNFIYKMTKYYQEQCRITKIINSFTQKCIDRKRNQLGDNKRLSILEQLLELNCLGNEFTNKELQDEIYTLYLAAQDTMAVTSSFASLMLGIHQEIQEKARREVKEILQDNSLTYETLDRLKYIEMVIKETLRLFPIAPFQIRHLNDELTLSNCTLPKDCELVIASYMTHRNSRYWKNSEEFIPERFSPEEHAQRHTYTFIPFSGGAMSCIGQKFAMMSLKTILVHILQNFRISSTIQMRDIQLRADISIRSLNGYNVSLNSI